MTNFLPVPNPVTATCETCFALVHSDHREHHSAWHAAGLVVEHPGDQGVETIAELERRGL